LRKKETTSSHATASSSHHIYCIQQCFKAHRSTTHEIICNSELCWICIFDVCITNNTI
jgi:hypothetical protein